jgi:undecaprenyl diphosphate synthase
MKKIFKIYLHTKNIPDPEILIRTGNTKRLSNFLLWQLAYTEIFFEKKLWPDFNEKDYIRIINKFKKLKEILEIFNVTKFIKIFLLYLF